MRLHLGGDNSMVIWGRLAGLCMALLVAIEVAAAQAPARVETARIETASLVIAEADSEIAIGLRVGPQDALPPQAFVRIRGLPQSVTLNEGYRIAAGVWAVPLFGLSNLKALIPKGLSGRSDIQISLVTVDGRVLAEAKSALVVAQLPTRTSAEKSVAPEKPSKPMEPQSLVPLAPPAPVAKSSKPETAEPKVATPVVRDAPSPPTEGQHVVPQPAAAPPAARPPVLSPDTKARLEGLTVSGDKHLVQGNLATARLFYLRAAESGLPLAAFKLAESYDSTELSRYPIQSPMDDKSEARRWYQRAKELGVSEAEARLKRLGP
jgi:hypothetical protein